MGEAHLGRGFGYIDDDELISILYRHCAELLARAPSPLNTAAQMASDGTEDHGTFFDFLAGYVGTIAGSTEPNSED